MTNSHYDRCLLAEWEYDPVILLSWPHSDSDWEPILREVTDYYINLTSQLVLNDIPVLIVSPDIDSVKESLYKIDNDKIHYCRVLTNDTWTRDFGPITIAENNTWKICDFKFNGWGLKFAACYDNLVNRELFSEDLLCADYENHLGFVLEGGSIESNGKGLILTTEHCLLSPNRNGGMTKADIENVLSATLGAKKILWIRNGELEGDDTDSHIDTLARFAPDNTIVYVGCQDPSDSHFKSLSMMKEEIRNLKDLEGKPFNLVELPLPDAIYDEHNHRLPATYANYLVTPNAVFVPVYNQPEKDEKACRIIKTVYNRKVVPIDSRILIVQHGSLHCATMQLPKAIIKL